MCHRKIITGCSLKVDPQSWQDIFLIRDELVSEILYTWVCANDFEGWFWKCLICSHIVTNISCNCHLYGYMLSALWMWPINLYIGIWAHKNSINGPLSCTGPLPNQPTLNSWKRYISNITSKLEAKLSLSLSRLYSPE